MSGFNLIDVIGLLEKAQDFGVQISYDEEGLIVQSQSAAEIDRLFLQELKNNKQYLIAYFKEQQQAAGNTDKIPAFSRESLSQLPLSYSQERLWFVDKLEGSIQYHVPAVIRLKGVLDITALSNALSSIVGRHEVLRTVIYENGGQPYQRILDKGGWKLNHIAGHSYQKDPEGLKTFITGLLCTPFDLHRDHMLKAYLVALEEDEHLLVLAMHHIASDGGSISVFVKEFIELYSAFSEGREPNLSALDIQFADYAIWQRQYLEGGVLEQQLSYWKQKLKHVTPLLLPTDFELPAAKSTRGALASFVIDKELAAGLQRLSRQEDATMYMTLLAAFKVLLYRYSTQEDICVGGAVAGRMRVELEPLIGFFINSLVLRSDLSGHPSFTSLLQQVRITTLNAYEHQDIPFQNVVEAVLRERDTSKNPLFQVIFVLQNGEKVPALQMGDLVIHDEPVARETSQFDLNWSIEERPDGIAVDIEYRSDLFKESTITRMFKHYVSLLQAIIRNPAQSIDALPLLNTAEQQLLGSFNATAALYPDKKTITTLFADQVMRTPDGIAVIYEQTQLSYCDLDLRSNQVAHYLIAAGIKPGDKVGLLSYRGLDMITAMLGILKSGAAYVPFHIDYPGERLRMMMEDAAVSYVLYTDSIRYADRDFADDTKGLLVSDAWSHAGTPIDLCADNTACVYVMYTSGTTGRPKGIAVSHQNITKLVFDESAIAVHPDDRVLQWSNYAFDGSTYDIYSALLKGACLCLLRDSQASDAFELARIITAEKITVWFVTTALFNNMVDSAIDSLLHLRKLLFGGEKVSPLHVSKALSLMGPGKLVHVYGPTETTVYATCYEIDSVDTACTIPIGRPLSNTQALILDPRGTPVPIGVSGELYIGGDGVSLGYVNNDAVTSEKFVQLVVAPGRWYRTGDRARWLETGVIEYVGRADDQVKIRGYRIELGEIATVLRQCHGVKDAIVIVDQHHEGEKRLLGYFVPAGDYDQEVIFDYLKERLPSYMIPAHLIAMDAFPLTVNGKVDQRALPAPVASSENKYEAPRNAREQTLANIWEELLGLEQVGIHTNFFEGGGHSLLAIRLVSAIRTAFKMEISVSSVFDYPTIASFANQLTSQQEQTMLLPPVVRQERSAQVPLSFNQERLWFIDMLEGSVQYHVPEVFRLEGMLNVAALSRALGGIVNRHEVLRTVIRSVDGVPHQQLLDADSWKLNIVDDQLYRKDATALSAYIQALMVQPFDLSEEHMLRAHLIIMDNSTHILVLNIHHIVSDGWSIGVLVRELVSLYHTANTAQPSLLVPLEIQYADYAIWQRKYLTGDALEKQLDYWKQQLSDVPALMLPTDYVRPAVQSSRGNVLHFEIDQLLTRGLNALSQQQGTTLFMTLLTAFNVLLYRYTGQADICVGTSIAGRTRQELEGLIGFFVNTLALRSDLSGDPSFAALLQQVKQTTLGAYSHQETPFEKVVQAVVKDRDLSRNPLFQVMFELQNTPEVPDLRLGDVHLAKETVAHTTAQFDLIVSMEEVAGCLTWYAEYSIDLFSEATINKMMAHFEQLLRSIVSQPDRKISALRMLDQAEIDQLLLTFNDTDTPYPDNNTVVTLFARQAALRPEATALVFGAAQMSYRVLDERSNQLAHCLRSLGVTTDTLVPLCIERSADMIIAILAIWKAGGAYVPVDPTYPKERILFMIAECEATVVVGDNILQQLSLPSAKVVALDADRALIDGYETTASLPAPVAGQLAYMIYTSGSTGIPKGVLIEHAGMLNHLFAKINDLQLQDQSIIAFTASYTFDISVWQMFAALLCGGRTIIYNTDIIFDPSRLLQSIAEEKVTILELVPSYLSSLLQLKAADTRTHLQYLLVTGETVSQAMLEQWFAHPLYKHIPVMNAYGPTEASDDITHHLMYDVPDRSNVSLGKPVQNMRIYIVDASLQLCALGVAGEICVSGVGVGRGYFKRPELTAAKFIQDSFRTDTVTRAYRTGDLGRWLPDGTIEHLGRIDNQVKIRGYRVELGEIEGVMTQHPMVRQATVLVSKDEHHHSRLVGYVVPIGAFDKDEVLLFLKEKLPEYMVPALLISLEEMPLTPNGKIDRRALQELDAGLLSAVEYVAPENDTELKLEAICRKLLELERIGIYDNLFELGMHSLLVMRLAAAVQDEFGIQVSVRTFFQLTTLSSLAKYMLVHKQRPVANASQRKTKIIEL